MQRVDVLLVVHEQTLLVVGRGVGDRLHLEVGALREEEGHRVSGRSCWIACHRPCTPASKVAPLAVGWSSVCGSAPGSTVVVVAAAGAAGVVVVVLVVVVASGPSTVVSRSEDAADGAVVVAAPPLTRARPINAAMTRTPM